MAESELEIETTETFETVNVNDNETEPETKTKPRLLTDEERELLGGNQYPDFDDEDLILIFGSMLYADVVPRCSVDTNSDNMPPPKPRKPKKYEIYKKELEEKLQNLPSPPPPISRPPPPKTNDLYNVEKLIADCAAARPRPMTPIIEDGKYFGGDFLIRCVYEEPKVPEDPPELFYEFKPGQPFSPTKKQLEFILGMTPKEGTEKEEKRLSPYTLNKYRENVAKVTQRKEELKRYMQEEETLVPPGDEHHKERMKMRAQFRRELHKEFEKSPKKKFRMKAWKYQQYYELPCDMRDIDEEEEKDP